MGLIPKKLEVHLFNIFYFDFVFFLGDCKKDIHALHVSIENVQPYNTSTVPKKSIRMFPDFGYKSAIFDRL